MEKKAKNVNYVWIVQQSVILILFSHPFFSVAERHTWTAGQGWFGRCSAVHWGQPPSQTLVTLYCHCVFLLACPSVCLSVSPSLPFFLSLPLSLSLSLSPPLSLSLPPPPLPLSIKASCICFCWFLLLIFWIFSSMSGGKSDKSTAVNLEENGCLLRQLILLLFLHQATAGWVCPGAAEPEGGGDSLCQVSWLPGHRVRQTPWKPTGTISVCVPEARFEWLSGICFFSSSFFSLLNPGTFCLCHSKIKIIC